ncbi:VOC family protein [Dinoroseobacter sp. S124A]|uniref:VOC family protein n=1 Tax=Dinoroseobacter sp. S124A TaxID=3415128 RepID=UPI003C7C1AE2
MSGSALAPVSAIDHGHLYVADLDAAVAWYGRVLGLSELPFRPRAAEGRYMATPKGQYCATIFPGRPPSDGDHTKAFRVTGTVFLGFAEVLPHPDVMGRTGTPLRIEDADDHGRAWSFYFQDPDGNHLELTTYDHDKVRAVLGEP